jgi:hypothetical protein
VGNFVVKAIDLRSLVGQVKITLDGLTIACTETPETIELTNVELD